MAAGISSTISHSSKLAGSRPNRLPGPPREPPPVIRTSRPGSANFFRLPAKENSTDTGCSRCSRAGSDGIALLTGQQMFANGQRRLVGEAGELHPGVIGAGGVDDQRAKAVRPLERP